MTTLKWNGLEIVIEYAEGSVRTGIDKSGNHWHQLMPFAYGRIKGTKGADQQPVDCILENERKPANTVFVAVMPESVDGEDKVLLGFANKQSAKNAYLSCYGGDTKYLKKIYALTVSQLKKRLKTRRGTYLAANYNDIAYNMNNYLVEYSPVRNTGKAKLEKDSDLSKADKKYNDSLLTRQRKPEDYEYALGSNPNDNLNQSAYFGSGEKR